MLKYKEKKICTTWYLETTTEANFTNKTLLEAARCGYGSLLAQLLKIDADVTTTNSDGMTPLHYAAYRGEESNVDLLLNHGAEVNTVDRDGCTPLHLAVGCKDVRTVHLLLKYGSDVNMVDDKGCTSLYWAVNYEDVPIVERLLSYGANVNMADSNGVTPLHLAVYCKGPNILDLLLKYNVELNLKDNNGLTPLHWAVQSGEVGLVEQLLNSGANLNEVDNDNHTPLLWAVDCGILPMVNLLLKCNADVNTKGNYDQTPLHWAVNCGNVSIVELLLNYGADIDTKNSKGVSALHLALHKKEWAVLELLLNSGADVNTKDNNGFTALHWAIHSKESCITEQLLNHSADVNSIDDNGFTLLHWAVRYQDATVVELLLKFGARVDTTDSEGVSALHIAVRFELEPILSVLLEFNVNVNLKDRNGFTALHWAVYCEKLRHVDRLLNYVSDVNVRDKNGYTPLHWACLIGKVPIVELLLKFNADVNAVGVDGLTPLYWAVHRGKLSVINELLSSGADVNVTDSEGVSVLHLSACIEDVDILQLLLSMGATVNVMDTSGYTPLHWAARYGKKPAVDRLIKHGADINAKDCDGNSVLHLALFYREAIITDLLLKLGADVNKTNNNGLTPLLLAAYYGEMHLVDLLLKFDAVVTTIEDKDDKLIHLAAIDKDITVKMNKERLKQQINKKAYGKIMDSNSYSLLHCAIQNGRLDIVDFLLKLGADVNVTDSDNRSPLHWAAKHNKSSIVYKLLAYGADVNRTDDKSITPLHIAVCCDEMPILELMLKLGVNVKVNARDNNGFAPLHWAALDGKAPVINCLLDYGAELNITDNKGNTPLHWAVRRKKVSIVEMLLKFEADVNATNCDGCTPLYCAVYCDSEEHIVDILLNNKANVNRTDNENISVLHLAMDSGDVSITKLLLEFGADVNLMDIHGQIPLHWGALSKKANAIDLVLNYGVNVNSRDTDGCTPLHWAVLQNDVHTINLLVKSGADVNIVSYNGQTPLFWALNHNEISIVELLLNYGAHVNISDIDNVSVLHLATRKDIHILNLLLKFGADLKSVDCNGYSLLHWTAFNGKIEVMKRLLNLGAIDVNLLDKNGHTALRWAMKRCDTSFVDLLVKFGADLNMTYQDGQTLLHMAIGSGQEHIINCLLNHSANVNVVNNEAATPLHVAVCRKKTFDVAHLLEFGADVNAKDKYGCTPLQYALHYDKNTIVDQFLKNGADVNMINCNGNTVLHEAVLCGKTPIVLMLLKSKVDVTRTNSAGNTPLHLAVIHRWLHIFDLLLDFSTDVNIKNKAGEMPLHLAARHAMIHIVYRLLNRGANVNMVNKDGHTPLHIAAKVGNSSVVNLLLSLGADVNVTDSNGDTVLHKAMHCGEYQIVKMLLNHGVKVNTLNKAGDSPLHLAIQYREEHITNLLLKFGADFNAADSTGNTPLHLAIRYGQPLLVGMLLNYSDDVNTTNNDGKTPLHIAARRKEVFIVYRLLNCSANLNITDGAGNTLLHLAVSYWKAPMVNLLLKLGAGVNTTNKIDITPLHITVLYGDVLTLKLLLKFGANMNVKSNSSNTPLHLAVIYDKLAMVEVLLKYGADVNTTSSVGNKPLSLPILLGDVPIVVPQLKEANVNATRNIANMPLHVAVFLGNASMVKLLLKYGADINAMNSTGNTPLHLAARRGDTAIVDLLLRCGADVLLRNFNWDTPLTVARIYNFQGNKGIVSLLETAEKLRNNILLSSNRTLNSCVIYRVQEQATSQNNLQLESQYFKRAGTSGVCGQLYVTKLLCLILIRILNDKQIEQFLLGTNIHGIGDIDDVCLRYQIIGKQKPVVLFVQAKHRQDREKRKLTVEDVRNPSGDFSLRKYFECYLEVKNRFWVDNEDPMFMGNFDNIECNFIIYTSVKDMFFKKKTERKISEKVHYLINTRDNTVFQYDHDETDIDYLVEVKVWQQLKKFCKIFLKFIISEDLPYYVIFMDKIISRYHVVIGRKVLKQYITSQTNKEFRLWVFRPEFFKSDCKYLDVLKRTFIKELSTKRYDLSEITHEDQEHLKQVIQNPCASTISELIGKLVTYCDKTKSLHLVKISAFEEMFKKYEFITLLKQLNKIVIHENVIAEAVRIKLTKLIIRLPQWFGNSDMNFSGSESEVQKRIKTLAEKLIHLFQENKKTKILNITVDVVGPEKSIEHDIIDIDGGIGGAVGNLLVLDTDTKMLKFDLENKTLPINVMLLLEEFKDDKYKPVNEKLEEYRIKINLKDFPKFSFDGDEYDRKEAEDFLSKLWFYTNQAKENEVENILKNNINKYYNIKKDVDHFIFKIHADAIFLRSHDKIQKWWMKKGKTFYMNQANDIFKQAKLACINNLLLAVINFIQNSNIISMDLKFNKRICQPDATIVNICKTLLDDIFCVHDTQNKSIKLNIKNREEIVNLLLTNSRLTSDGNPSNKSQPQTFSNIYQSKGCTDLQDSMLPKFKYLKRTDTFGMCGQLYETRLLCLIFMRLINDEQIEHFLLGTNIRDIGDMDDVCLRYKVRDREKPIVLFVQAKHREDREKRTLTVEDVQSASGDFSLRKYFESYLRIRDKFRTDNKDPMFEGNFSDVECNFVLYTSAKQCFKKKKTERKISEKVHYLINTGYDAEFQYDYNENDIDYLTEMTVRKRLNKLGVIFLELIMSEKDKSDMIMADKGIASYHVAMSRNVLQQCRIQDINKEYRLWKFRPVFFESNCKYLIALKETFIKELSTKRYDQSKITNEDRENFKRAIYDPCAFTISKLIGKLIIYNDTTNNLQLLEISSFKKILENDESIKLLDQFKTIVIPKDAIAEAVRIKLTALVIKLPQAFGNLDMIFRGSEIKVRRRMNALAEKLMQIFKTNEKSKIIDINDGVVGPGRSIEQGIIDINGGIGSAVGNLFVLDKNSKMLKFDLENRALPKYAALFLEELKNDRHKPINKNLSEYQFKINIKGFPKYSFNGDEYDGKQAKDFLNMLWFYTNQAKENEVEQILKDDISEYYNNKIEQNCKIKSNFSDRIYLSSHYEIQKWWMQVNESPYLSRASELFKRVKLADIDNLLLTIINYMYISKIYSIDMNFKQHVTEHAKLVEMHQTFNNISSRLFNIFDSEFRESINIKLPDVFNTTDSNVGFVELLFILEIHPEMEWVALKISAESECTNYFLIAKAGPGSGCRRAKDGFLLQQLYNGGEGYYIEGGKDPDDIYGHFCKK